MGVGVENDRQCLFFRLVLMKAEVAELSARSTLSSDASLLSSLPYLSLSSTYMYTRICFFFCDGIISSGSLLTIMILAGSVHTLPLF